MPRMTTQQKLDCLLTQLAVLTPQQGDPVSLSAQDITLSCNNLVSKITHDSRRPEEVKPIDESDVGVRCGTERTTRPETDPEG